MRFCPDDKQHFTIELLRNGKVFETHSFDGVVKNAKSRASKLAHERQCAYRIKKKNVRQ